MTPRVVLRPDSDGLLDDVAVRDVEMFRAEMMTDRHLWMCCYLPGTGAEYDRIAFSVSVKRGRLVLAVTELPAGEVTYEPEKAS